LIVPSVSSIVFVQYMPHQGELSNIKEKIRQLTEPSSEKIERTKEIITRANQNRSEKNKRF